MAKVSSIVEGDTWKLCLNSIQRTQEVWNDLNRVLRGSQDLMDQVLQNQNKALSFTFKSAWNAVRKHYIKEIWIQFRDAAESLGSGTVVAVNVSLVVTKVVADAIASLIPCIISDTMKNSVTDGASDTRVLAEFPEANKHISGGDPGARKSELWMGIQ
ncbi:hypothetical protein NE237_025803 [Protea cynaroides]|uniref:Uncharacterized protein n=1 Tax=Protea cynaroides TaxID=273540 RepID=A0A9Q0H6X8_9MAGN|nr:hypothetical protein NE237_025803 [Protea cynaroides]